MQWFRALTWMSILFLGMHIFIYTSMKKLRDQPSQNVLAMAVALFPVQLILTVDGLTYSRYRNYQIIKYKSMETTIKFRYACENNFHAVFIFSAPKRFAYSLPPFFITFNLWSHFGSMLCLLISVVYFCLKN